MRVVIPVLESMEYVVEEMNSVIEQLMAGDRVPRATYLHLQARFADLHVALASAKERLGVARRNVM